MLIYLYIIVDSVRQKYLIITISAMCDQFLDTRPDAYLKYFQIETEEILCLSILRMNN